MILRGQVTAASIVVEKEKSINFCLCCRDRKFKIKYADILDIEEREIGHFLVKYVDRSSRPFKVSHRVIQMHRRDHRGSTSSQHSLTNLNIEEDEELHENIEETILSRAYSGCLAPKERQPILVLVNPHSGPGDAAKNYKERAAKVFAAAGLKTKVINTEYPGHATEIVRNIPLSDHDTIVCVSGDGLPHEVLNGLATRPMDSSRALQHFGIAQLPGGSGNAMCLSLNDGDNDWTATALGIVKGLPEPVDIMGISQDHKYYYSFLSQSYGIVADCDLGTEELRWMGGARFTVGIVYKCLVGNQYPCEIAYKEVESDNLNATTTTIGENTGVPNDSDHTGASNSSSNGADSNTTNGTPIKDLTDSPKFGTESSKLPSPPPVPLVSGRLTVNDPLPSDWKVETHQDLSMFYVGKMNWMSSDALVFPKSEPLDGAMDMIVWDNSFGSIQSLLALSKFEKGTHVSSIPFYKKIQAYRLTPLGKEQHLSIDGEAYPCAPLQVEVIPGAARFITPCT